MTTRVTPLVIALLLTTSFSVSLITSVSAAPELSGVWLLNLPDSESELFLTAEGQRILNAYDLLNDDPSLACTPASSARIWANPNSLIKIEQFADRVQISYELFDLRREIPLGDASTLTDLPSTRNLDGTYFPEMGSSFAHYEGDHLLIESRNHAPGYIRTSRGIPQSANTIALEDLSVVDGVLHITHTYSDSTLFEQAFVLNYTFYRASETDVSIYNCTDADYDWFNALNAKPEGDSQ
jgi:hypothetical protein